MTRMKIVASASAAVAVTVALGTVSEAYTTFARWASTPVLVYVNPQNADVDPEAATGALQTAMNEWNTRSGSSFQYVYLGRTHDTTTGYDGRNVILFRNAGDGSALATTYSWWSGTKMLDSDIVFWDAPFAFFTGTTGCNAGAYIEDIAVHELGHALGLGHSTASDASMYPTYKYCSQHMRSLAADDMAGAQELYPASEGAMNTAPTITVSAPASSTTVSQATSLAFSGSAFDQQDGALTAGLTWRSNLDGHIGTGGSFSAMLSTGTHIISVTVTDSGGLSASTQVTVTVTPPTSAAPAPGPALQATGHKVKGLQKVDLAWSGFADATVTIYRNSTSIGSTPNDGTYTDAIDQRGSGTYQYKVCGPTSGVCSNSVSVTF
jgi:hypothetical protein